jgi:hypothetical protein
MSSSNSNEQHASSDDAHAVEEEVTATNAKKAQELDAIKLRQKERSKKNYEEVEKPKREAKRRAKQGKRQPRKTIKIQKELNNFEKKDILQKFVNNLLIKPHKKWGKELKNNLRYDLLQHYSALDGDNGLQVVGNVKATTYIIKLAIPNNNYKDGVQSMNLFEVRQSNLPNANLGLFAKKSFAAGDIMGVYYGRIQPRAKMTHSQYAVESEEHGIIMDAEGGPDRKKPMYFGLQIANDPTICVKSSKMATRTHAKGETHNFFIDDDFVAVASRNINVDDELYLNYGWDVQHSSCTCLGCEYMKMKHTFSRDK